MRNRKYSRHELEKMDIDTLDKMAFGVTSGQCVVTLSHKIHIQYPGDLENAQHAFDTKGMEWARQVDLSDPVEVSIDNNGRWNLEDGHHRWLAASKTGRSLTALINVKGKPIERILAQQSAEPAEKSIGRTIPRRQIPRRS